MTPRLLFLGAVIPQTNTTPKAIRKAIGFPDQAAVAFAIHDNAD
jgi:hypothetical protein